MIDIKIALQYILADILIMLFKIKQKIVSRDPFIYLLIFKRSGAYM